MEYGYLVRVGKGKIEGSIIEVVVIGIGIVLCFWGDDLELGVRKRVIENCIGVWEGRFWFRWFVSVWFGEVFFRCVFYFNSFIYIVFRLLYNCKVS